MVMAVKLILNCFGELDAFNALMRLKAWTRDVRCELIYFRLCNEKYKDDLFSI